jgi:hypothetical protein
MAVRGVQEDLQLMAVRLEELRAEVEPLAPGLRALGGLPQYGKTLASAPEMLGAAQRLAATAAAMGPQVEWLLGVDAPRTYLLLVQNNHELRATGGFLSAFGLLALDGGQVAGLHFADSYEYFSTDHEYPPAPAPMQQYMGIQILVPRDANWSPDLPATAEAVRRLYAQETGVTVDGVVTLDLDAVRRLVAGLGNVRVPGVPEPITAENVEQVLVQLWEDPPEEEPGPAGTEGEPAAGASTGAASDSAATGDWWSRRKDFVPLVAGAALARLQAGDFDPAALVLELAAALDGRAIQIWVAQPEAQRVLAAAGWDGGLHPQAGADFLAVVDSNVGYNKVDAAIQRAVGYAVTWPQATVAPAEVTLTLTYTHPVAAADPGCDPAPRYGDTYADLIARCYFDYVRVYAPGGSRLLDVSGIDPQTVTSGAGEQGTEVFGGYFVLPPGEVKTLAFVYRLPEGLRRGEYRLRVQRQAGTDPLPVQVTVAGAGGDGVQTAEQAQVQPALTQAVVQTTVISTGSWDFEPIP